MRSPGDLCQESGSSWEAQTGRDSDFPRTQGVFDMNTGPEARMARIALKWSPETRRVLGRNRGRNRCTAETDAKETDSVRIRIGRSDEMRPLNPISIFTGPVETKSRSEKSSPEHMFRLGEMGEEGGSMAELGLHGGVASAPTRRPETVQRLIQGAFTLQGAEFEGLAA